MHSQTTCGSRVVTFDFTHMTTRPGPGVRLTFDFTHWLDATSRGTSPLHHFGFFSIERVRALLVEGADVHAGDAGADAPTPVSLASSLIP
jgi:hypothetical protein